MSDAIRAMKAGKVPAAARLMKKHLAKNPDDGTALHMMGVIAFQLDQAEDAAHYLGRAIEIGTDNPSHYANWGLALKSAGRLPEALDAYDKSVAMDPTAASVWNDRGNALAAMGQLAAAEDSFQQSIKLDAHDAKTHANLGGVLLSLGRIDAAVGSYRKSTKLNGRLAAAHNGLGNAMARAGDTDDAIAAFKKAIDLDADFGEALGNLASLYEELSRLDDARAMAARALTVEPGHPHASLVLAKCERRAGAFQAGIDLLSTVDTANLSAALTRDVAFEQSRLYDRAGDAAGAFAAMTRGNAEALIAEGVDEQAGNAFLRSVATLRTWTPPAHPTETQTARFDDGETDPVFLVGFPRSGTTLLGQIMDSHSDLVMIEERPMLDAVIAKIRDGFGGYPGGVADLTVDDIAKLRKLYFGLVDDEVERTEGQRVVDKFPLHLVNVGLIQTLFPDSKIIMAMRHPCDVVLSCFMQNFRPNAAMANFFSTERGAVAYNAVMDLWMHEAAYTTLDHHTIRYEDVVTDFDQAVGGLLTFLGLPWQDSVRDYAENARARGRIDTPSYHQVTEAIYTRARYRWYAYEAELAPIMETLAPWISTFGYTDIED
jgi:tetratricopeptide (TPR) repeat protein